MKHSILNLVMILTLVTSLCAVGAIQTASPTRADGTMQWNAQVISGGSFHTVGLESDGTVIAVGDNQNEACNVAAWTDIVQVSGGVIHTVGLKPDGTVVAAGVGAEGQCEVGGWTDIVQVSAGGHTVGLKSDGTVVAVGYDVGGQCEVDSWTDIVQVSAGGYHTAGLKPDGTVVAVGYNHLGQCEVGSWTDIVQVSAGAGHTVGLKSDGTVVAVGYNNYGQCEVGGWTDIVQVSAGASHTVGLKSDGTVVAVGQDFLGRCEVGGWTDIVQVSAGASHTVGLKSDGTVVAVGSNAYGQCDVGSWILMVNCVDSDEDGACDYLDGCPADPNKTEPGACGCGVADTDSDGDGTPNCNDNCPADPNPSQSDIDWDGNGDLCDICPADALDECDRNGSTAEEIIADEGGTVETPDGGLVIDIDPGDLSEDTTISITQMTPPNPEVDLMIGPSPGLGVAIAIYDLEPDGTVFNNPVNITVTADVTNLNQNQRDRLKLYLNTDTDGDGVEDKFVSIESTSCSVVEDPIGTFTQICQTTLAHFSTIAMLAPLDSDDDGVPNLFADEEDNCPSTYNPGQEDTDEDGVGDACDTLVDISLALDGASRPIPTGWEIPVTIEFFEPGSDPFTEPAVCSYSGTTTYNSGPPEIEVFQVTGIAPETYDVTAKCAGTLMNIKRNVVISAPSTSVDLGMLVSGDCDDNSLIDFTDLGWILGAYDAYPGNPDWNPGADLNLNDLIDWVDLGLLLSHYDMASPVEVP